MLEEDNHYWQVRIYQSRNSDEDDQSCAGQTNTAGRKQQLYIQTKNKAKLKTGKWTQENTSEKQTKQAGLSKVTLEISSGISYEVSLL